MVTFTTGGEMKHHISRFSVHQTAKTLAALQGVIGLVYIPVGFLFDSISPPEEQLGLIWLAAPILFLFLGYLFIALACLVYNGSAKITGGIGFTLVPDSVDGEQS